MRLLRTFVFVLLGVAVILGLVALVLPKSSRIVKEITIQADPLMIFNDLRDYQNWVHWSPWYEMDPTASYFYEGTPGEIGFVMSWSGQEVGEGSLTLVEIKEPIYLEGRLEFVRPRVGLSKDIWEIQSVEGGTLVKWINESNLDYPIGRLLGPFLEGMIGKDFERGLQRLKTHMENLNPELKPSEAPKEKPMAPSPTTGEMDTQDPALSQPEPETETKSIDQ